MLQTAAADHDAHSFISEASFEHRVVFERIAPRSAGGSAE
jgi:hypothetical protein